jgi:hypothetical protein
MRLLYRRYDKQFFWQGGELIYATVIEDNFAMELSLCILI